MNRNRLSYWLAGAAVFMAAGLALDQGLLSASDGSYASPTEVASTAPPDGSGDAPAIVAQASPEAAPTQTTTTTTTTTIHGGWTVTCRAGADAAQETCSAEFRVVSKENKAVVLIWLLGRDKEGKLLSEFVTPSDILIKPGVAVTLNDAKPSRAEFISCTTQQGCRASMELTPKLARELKEATKAKVGLTLLNGKVMEIGIEISGVGPALTELGA